MNLPSPPHDTPIERIIGWGGLAVSLLFLIAIGATTRGVPLHDELGHLLVARDAWESPRLIFNAWGRTANTLLFMPVAWLPLVIARSWTALLSTVAALLAWRIAKREGVRFACLVPLLTLLQMHWLETAWAALTLAPLALVGMASVWLAQRGRWKVAALVAGLLPLIRHETILLAAFFTALCLMRRSWIAALLTAVPFVLNNAFAFALFGDLPLQEYLAPHATDHWGSGSLWHFAAGFVGGVGIPCLILCVLGAVEVIRNRALLLLMMGCAVYFLTHTLLFYFGLYATGGFRIFLAPLAPAIGILAALGLDLISGRGFDMAEAAIKCPVPNRNRWAWIIATIFLVLMVYSDRDFHRVEITHEESGIDEAIEFLNASEWRETPVITSHVWFLYRRPQPIPNDGRVLWINIHRMENLPEGSLVLWEPSYSELWGITRETLDDPAMGFDAIWRGEASVTLYRRAHQPLVDSE